MVEDVGGALATAHAAGVVHRDVKPANVLLDEAGHFYLGDFGIALEATQLSDPTAALSAGSPAYASPEQLRREPLGPSADVHGLGISIYEALTGRLPFPSAATQAELLRRQLHDPIPSVRDSRNSVPPAVDAVLAKATAKDPTARYQTTDELVAEFVAALDGGPAAVIGRPGVATTVSVEAARNPYKGLRAFTEADSADFYGRERLVDRIVEVLARTDSAGQIAAVVGPSGIGKSSAVRAGLLPALRKGAVAGSEQWFVATMKPGRDPFEELASALLRVATHTPDNMMSQLVEDHRGIARVVKALVPEDSNSDVLLVIDQFEELFTLVDNSAVTRRFLDAVEHALTDARCPLRIVLTMRADFWDRPLRPRLLRKTHRQIHDQRHSPRPRRTGAGHRRTGPPRRLRVRTGPGVGDHGRCHRPARSPSIAPIRPDRVVGPAGVGPADTRCVPRARWRGRRPHPTGRGTLRKALTRTSKLKFVESSAGWSLSARAPRTPDVAFYGPSSPPAPRPTLSSNATAPRDFSPSTPTPPPREPTVEVAHEALIRQWSRLRAWLDEDRDGLRLERHLQAAAMEWDAAGRPESELYRGGRLEAAEEWSEDDPNELAEIEASFLRSSVEQRSAELEAQRRTNQRLQRLLTGVAIVAAVAFIAGAVAFQQRSRANDSAAEARAQAHIATEAQADALEQAGIAEQQTQVAERKSELAVAARSDAEAAAAGERLARTEAEIRRMVSDAALLVEEDPALAMLVAAVAYKQAPRAETLGALQRALSRTDGLLGYIGTGTAYSNLDFTGDGRLVARSDTGIDVWNVSSRRLLTSIEIVGPGDVVLLSDGRHAVAAANDGIWHRVDIDAGEVVATSTLGSPITALAAPAGEGPIAVGRADGTVSLVEMPPLIPGQMVARLEFTTNSLREVGIIFPGPVLTQREQHIEALAFGANDRTLAIADRSDTISVFALSTGEVVWDSSGRDRVVFAGFRENADAGNIGALRFDRAGGLLLTGEYGGGMRLDPVTGEPTHYWPVFTDNAPEAIELTDGRVLVGSLVIDAASGEEIRILKATEGQTIGIDVNVRGNLAAISTSVGIALWSLDRSQLLARVGTDQLVWNHDPDDWFGLACRSAGRNMTAAEWSQYGPTDKTYDLICDQWPGPA